jgi:hypothetical protein
MKNVYLEQVILNGINVQTRAEKIRLQESEVRTMLTVFSYAKWISHHGFLLEKWPVSGKFHKDVIKRIVTYVILSLSFSKVGMTVHQHILWASCLNFWWNEGYLCILICLTFQVAIQTIIPLLCVSYLSHCNYMPKWLYSSRFYYRGNVKLSL